VKERDEERKKRGRGGGSGVGRVGERRRAGGVRQAQRRERKREMERGRRGERRREEERGPSRKDQGRVISCGCTVRSGSDVTCNSRSKVMEFASRAAGNSKKSSISSAS
jgi:hypothetical protein